MTDPNPASRPEPLTAVMSTSTDSETLHVEDGERVFPCYCGETHRGQYAFEDWLHHNCLHKPALMPLVDPDIFMCPDCGRVFSIEAAVANNGGQGG